MSHTRVNYTDIEPVSGALHTLSDQLDSEEVGVTIARCEPGWRNRPHDHADSDHEEISILMEGRATVVDDDESVEIESGDAIRIPPESTRQIRTGETESAFVLVSAPAFRCITTAETADDDGSWPQMALLADLGRSTIAPSSRSTLDLDIIETFR